MNPLLPGIALSCLLLTLFQSRTDASTAPPADNKGKLYLCLNSCAMCVEHWERGLYNGPKCAKQCLKHKGQRIVDPDCVKLKMFNYEPEVLKQHRKFIRQQIENEGED